MKRRNYKFHQFVIKERGPINTAIFDFLKGNVYHVKNDLNDKFDHCLYEEIDDFIQSLKKEELIIEVDEGTWIPSILTELDEDDIPLELELEEGIDLSLVKNQFQGYNISKVICYGCKTCSQIFPSAKIVLREKDFRKCIKLSQVKEEFEKVEKDMYIFNKNFNSCFGRKITVAKNGDIKPCIYSTIVLGNLKNRNIDDIVNSKVKKYWKITKDKVKKCKDCELRYGCFDCREIAFREGNDLYATNPNCKYDPYSGYWE